MGKGCTRGGHGDLLHLCNEENENGDDCAMRRMIIRMRVIMIMLMAIIAIMKLILVFKRATKRIKLAANQSGRIWLTFQKVGKTNVFNIALIAFILTFYPACFKIEEGDISV